NFGLVASNALHYFFKSAAYLRRRVAGLVSNRDFQISKLFVDVDEPETNLSTECIYKRTHGKPSLAYIRSRQHCYAARRRIESLHAIPAGRVPSCRPGTCRSRHRPRCARCTSEPWHCTLEGPLSARCIDWRSRVGQLDEQRRAKQDREGE